MAVEDNKTAGVKIIIGPHAGACGLLGVTIRGSEVPGVKKVVIDREYFEKEKRRCKKLNGGKIGCPLCTADPNCASSVAKFCPFEE
jgi:hypothetical protein